MKRLTKSVALIALGVLFTTASLDARPNQNSQTPILPDRAVEGGESGDVRQDRPKKGHKKGPKIAILKELRNLELTDEQKELIKALADVHKENMQAFKEEHSRGEVYLEALSETGFDTSVYLDDVAAINAIRGPIVAEFIQAVVEVLTEEQRVALEAALAAEPSEDKAADFARKRLAR